MQEVMEKIVIVRYDAYKDSGESWIGEIPEHWKIKKLKHLFIEKKHTSNPTLNCGSISFGIVVFKDDEKIPLSTKASYQEVLKGEFLINPLNLNYDLISLRIALSNINVVVSPGYIVLKNISDLNKDYFKYLLHRYDVAYMKLLGSGVRQTISFAHIANSFLLFPPIEEQTAITAILDRKTAHIDKAISQKEKLIELLKERRQILIHQAVTRGLNPEVQMKDSGVDWIGEVPMHWEAIKMKFITDKINDGTHGSFPRVENGYRLLSVRNLVNDRFVFLEDDSRISLRHYKEISSKFKVQKDDIQLAIVGATLGKVALVGEHSEPFVTQRSVATIRVKDSRISACYLYYFVKSYLFQSYLWRNAGFSAQPGVYLGTIQDSYVLVPPRKEQDFITEYLTKIFNKFDHLIERKNIEIEKLKEYKSTLINSAVTGKIKVF